PGITAMSASASREKRPRDLRVNLVQHAAGRDPRDNLNNLEKMLAAAPAADLTLLPEVFALRGSGQDYRDAAETIPGPLCRWAADQARRRRTWLLAGSIVESAGRRRYNTSLLFDSRGRLAARYRKIHLFSVTLPNGKRLREQAVYDAGRQPVVADVAGWRCGLSICYDLRFPELYRRHAEAGAHILLVPADFTRTTGRAHWRQLLLARAIENQAFVIAANQCGRNPANGVESYGHSLAVDPWGRILAEAGGRATVLQTRLDFRVLEEVRARLPALAHRRQLPRAMPAAGPT
ncbi:MAG: carbon-nitrogen hydrolase family protein, partial [Kiritimatiellia bacterium]